jgi:hypothetical protein
VLIILFGAFLRFYKLSEIPNGVYVDEAAIGYNAYAISETGRDEYGQFMPIFLRSFMAFSSPLYVYLSAIPVSIFGLSAFSVRFISALSGVTLIFVVYKIVDKFFKYKNKYISLVAAFMFATSPWSIFFSRGSFEANLALLILGIAIYLMLFPERYKYLIAAAVLLGISSYAYHTLRLIPILLIPAHLLIFKSKKYDYRKAAILFFVFLITIIPQIIISTTPAFSARASGLFYSDVVSTQSEKILFLPKIISLPLSFIREFGAQFTAYFSPRNLFLLGDSDLQRSIPEMGLFAMWLAIPYLMGLYLLAKKLPEKNTIFVFGMLFIFATPAALAKDPFSSLRALNLIIPTVLVIAVGIDFISEKLSKKIFYSIFIFLTIISLVNLWRGYFVLFPAERAVIWNYGYEQLSEEISKSDEHFVIDNSRVKPPHILLAFYMRIDPEIYQEYAKTKIINGYYDDTDFDTYYELENFETRAINWEKDIYKEQVLVGDELAISEEQINEHYLEKVFKIYDPLNKLVFQGYRTNPEKKCESIGNVNSLCHPELDSGSM